MSLKEMDGDGCWWVSVGGCTCNLKEGYKYKSTEPAGKYTHKCTVY